MQDESLKKLCRDRKEFRDKNNKQSIDTFKLLIKYYLLCKFL